jgi:hypothetical protein
MDVITLEEITPDQEKQFNRVVVGILEKSGQKNKIAVDRILARDDQLESILVPAFARLGSDLPLVDFALLEPITIVQCSAIESFKVAEKFASGTHDGVAIGYLGDNFKEHFLGKSETNVPAQQLRVHRLCKNLKDSAIIAELGGEQSVETSLATMWELMKKQGQGQMGDLLVTSNYANIFYIRDNNGVLWAVYCRWDTVCCAWDVGARPITRPGWYTNYQIFSH